MSNDTVAGTVERRTSDEALGLWLEATGFRSAKTVARELLRQEGGVFTPPVAQASDVFWSENEGWRGEYTALLGANRERLFGLFQDGALQRALEESHVVELLDHRLETLHTAAASWAEQAGRDAEAKERRTHAEPSRVAQLLGLRPGPMVDGLLKTGERVTFLAAARTARVNADALEAAATLLAQLRGWLGGVGRQRAALRQATAQAWDLAQAERALRLDQANRGALTTDLPMGYVAYLARAVAHEDPDVARREAVRALRAAYTAGQPPSAEAILRAIRTAATPPGGEPAGLVEAVATIAGELAMDPGALWRQVLSHLGTVAFRAAPAMALGTPAGGPPTSYLFQVLPAGSAATVGAEGESEVRAAFFRQEDGPRARLGIVQVWTNLDLATLPAYQALLPALDQAAREANPYILPIVEGWRAPLQATVGEPAAAAASNGAAPHGPVAAGQWISYSATGEEPEGDDPPW